MTRWMGVDVGGPRKGFDVAVVDTRSVMALPRARRLGCEEVVALVEEHRPVLVGVDSPRRCAPDGSTARADERHLAREVCGIRWTPDRARLDAGGDYYAWVREGLRLYAALRAAGVEVVEVFPTASWTRWFGPRGQQRRSVWTGAGLTRLGLTGTPARTSQDQRDAIAAAVTARQHSAAETQRIGEIVVPAGRWPG